jgi:hypothetical protein
LGTKSVYCEAIDSSGNMGNGSFQVTVRDTTRPTLTLPVSPLTVNSSNPQLGCEFNCDPTSVNFTVSAIDNVDGSVPVNCTPPSGSTFYLGTKSVYCEAIDSSGNMGNGSFQVTVERRSEAIVGLISSPNATAPIITVPEDITMEANSSEGAIVTFEVFAVDDVDGIVPVTCTPVSGSTFPIGETIVNCETTDSAGNTATASFRVTVNSASDTTAPIITVPEDIQRPREEAPPAEAPPAEAPPAEAPPAEAPPAEDVQE